MQVIVSGVRKLAYSSRVAWPTQRSKLVSAPVLRISKCNGLALGTS
jgi:hypothetical protein